nr:GAF domain-containing protein [Quisquiliibacterium transsilvanicum]
MEKVFRLRGADIYRVLEVNRIQQVKALPVLAARCDLAAAARAVSRRLADCEDLASVLQATMDGLGRDLRIDHAILWLLDERRGMLFAIASRGYAQAGTGAELPMDDAGLAGVALREGVPIRIGHMARMYRYGRTLLAQAQDLGIEAAMRAEIPLPGLATPCSQLAVPLRARGRSVGVLLVESESDQFFGYDDEDALALLCAQLAQALLTLQPEEGENVHALRAHDLAPVPAAGAGAAGPPLRIRHYARDDSVFIDDSYLIKGVAGAILWKLANDAVVSGRTAFTSRELRLEGRRLRLPDVQDNLAVRLLLLQRRLADWAGPLQIRRVGRGLYQLVTDRQLVLVEER